MFLVTSSVKGTQAVGTIAFLLAVWHRQARFCLWCHTESHTSTGRQGSLCITGLFISIFPSLYQLIFVTWINWELLLSYVFMHFFQSQRTTEDSNQSRYYSTASYWHWNSHWVSPAGYRVEPRWWPILGHIGIIARPKETNQNLAKRWLIPVSPEKQESRGCMQKQTPAFRIGKGLDDKSGTFWEPSDHKSFACVFAMALSL